jgi:hypothetical protein
MVGQLISDELENMWKEVAVVTKMKILSWRWEQRGILIRMLCPGRDSNRALPEQKSDALPTLFLVKNGTRENICELGLNLD